ncbi:uncharacterized protein HD556DRAFT_739548 [Suillus plorans]|uniref:Uncharacterized protein n=1 Tax=Suillus plorans TaxID=116603 RepID=A0A9P7AIC1_9AGAM|nr:uncharacterized protein HD556DRAFT_739548 [Suillus plorans]KAG1790178.1 hypothetical protein HD556DRAFT_739548 [Suillus plorans]
MIVGRAPDMLQLYVDFGLHDDGSGHVGLKTPPTHEALTLANPGASHETRWKGLTGTSSRFELFLGFAARIFKAGR